MGNHITRGIDGIISSALGMSYINKKNNSGRLTINYKNLEQFELISKLLKQR